MSDPEAMMKTFSDKTGDGWMIICSALFSGPALGWENPPAKYMILTMLGIGPGDQIQQDIPYQPQKYKISFVRLG